MGTTVFTWTRFKLRWVPMFGLLVIALVPAIALNLFVWPGAGWPWAIGAITGLAATAAFDWRLGSALALLTALAGALAVLASPAPITSAIVMSAVAAFPAFMARAGQHVVAILVPIFVGFLVITPPAIFAASTTPVEVNEIYTLALMALIASGGLWASGITWILTSRRPRHRFATLDLDSSFMYGTVLATSVGFATMIILSSFPDGYGAWLILLIVMVVRLGPVATTHRAMQQVAGNLTGLVGAAALLALVPSHAATAVVAVLVLSVALTLLVMKAPYWAFATFLTPGIVLLAGSGAEPVRDIDVRLAGVILACALATSAVYAGRWTMHRTQRH